LVPVADAPVILAPSGLLGVAAPALCVAIALLLMRRVAGNYGIMA
jgi:hypothetical protein